MHLRSMKQQGGLHVLAGVEAARVEAAGEAGHSQSGTSVASMTEVQAEVCVREDETGMREEKAHMGLMLAFTRCHESKHDVLHALDHE